MVKRQPKDKLSSETAFEHTPSQTIMYQPSKMANAYSSAILGEYHDLLDEILRPGVLVNMRRDKAYAERAWNSATAAAGGRRCTSLLEVDISQCDKSQTLRNLVRYFYFLRQLGLGEELEELWRAVLYRKTAYAPDTRFRIDFVFQVVSGLFATISINSIVSAEAFVECGGVTREGLVALVVSGDDALGRLRGETRPSGTVAAVSDAYAAEYNFEAKVFQPEVGSWCSCLLVEVEGYEFFVRSPEKVFSSLARSQTVSYVVAEAFVSFVDSTEAYEWEELVVGVAEAVKKREGRRTAPVAMSRGIATVRRSEELFASRFEGRRRLV